jgi:glutaminase
MDYRKIIQRVYQEVRAMEDSGSLPTYIRELANVNPEKLGAHLTTIDGMNYGVGDFQERFSIQSISKVFSLCLAYHLLDADLWERVNVEPSGTAFNSLVQLEYEEGIPRNPLINSGAIVVCDILLDLLKDPKKELLEFVQKVSRSSSISYNEQVEESEKAVGFRNRAMINLMKSFDNIKNNVDEVLDLYFHLCSLEFSCEELSRAFMFLANDGIDPFSDERILTLSQSKRVNAIMMTCGFYDEAGEFSFRVGLPGKSGVGGGIVAVHPEHYSIAVWSPLLNPKGNSFRGMKFLEHFTTESGLSIF